MKYCFVCWRPYQLLNVINYINTKPFSEKNTCLDIYISDIVNRESLNEEYLKERFNHVIFFKEDKDSNKLKILKNYLFLRRGLKEDINYTYEFTHYDVIVGSGYLSFFVRMCNYNKNAKVIMLEDGTATYMNNEVEMFNKSRKSRVLKKIGRGLLAVKVDYGFSYHPELIQISPYYPVKAINTPDEKCVADCKKIFFNSINDEYKYKKIVYLTSDDMPLEKYNFDENKFINKLSRYKNDIIVRVHPRKTDKNIDLLLDNNNYIWELQSHLIQKETILIAIFSTAQFTPHLLFMKNCRLIFLYKLVFPANSSLYKNAEKFIRAFSVDYSGKIYIPETEKEFCSILDSLNK